MRRALTMAPHERVVQEGEYRFSPHILWDLSQPEHSRILLGPLSKDAGGWGTCERTFSGKDDQAYRDLLEPIALAREYLTQKPMYGMSTFRPNKQFIREMKRFGVLAADFSPDRNPIDFFDIEQKYWELFWYQADAKDKWPFLR